MTQGKEPRLRWGRRRGRWREDEGGLLSAGWARSRRREIRPVVHNRRQDTGSRPRHDVRPPCGDDVLPQVPLSGREGSNHCALKYSESQHGEGATCMCTDRLDKVSS